MRRQILARVVNHTSGPIPNWAVRELCRDVLPIVTLLRNATGVDPRLAWQAQTVYCQLKDVDAAIGGIFPEETRDEQGTRAAVA